MRKPRVSYRVAVPWSKSLAAVQLGTMHTGFGAAWGQRVQQQMSKYGLKAAHTAAAAAAAIAIALVVALVVAVASARK